MMAEVELVVGALLLLLGCRVFWLLVGFAGFLAGYELAGEWMLGASPEWLLAVSLVLGVFGMLLAVFLQKVAVAAAGFVVGGFITLRLAVVLGLALGPYDLLVFIVGGLVGALVLWSLFQWALVVITALLGAVILAEYLPVTPVYRVLVLVTLFVIGLCVQARIKKRSRLRITDD